MEFGEGVREALAREFMEEAGLKVRVRGLLDVSEGSFKHEKRFHHEINLVFHVELAGRLPKRGLPTVTTREKKIDFVWCTKSEIREADVRPATGRMLLLRTTASTFRLPDIFQSDI